MATMEEALFKRVTGDALVAAILGTRLYPELPQAVVYPAAAYQVISRRHSQHFGGSSNFRRARLQFDVYAETWAECIKLGDAIISALDGWREVVDLGTPEEPDLVEVQGVFCTIDRDANESGTVLSSPGRVRRRLIEFTVVV